MPSKNLNYGPNFRPTLIALTSSVRTQRKGDSLVFGYRKKVENQFLTLRISRNRHIPHPVVLLAKAYIRAISEAKSK
jgi:hypothetical protein